MLRLFSGTSLRGVPLLMLVCALASPLPPVHAAWDLYSVMTASSPLEGVLDMSFINSLEGWAITGPTTLKVHHTTDGGQTWTQLFVDPEGSMLWLVPRSRIQFINSQEGWLVPNAVWGTGKLLHSSDGGVTWGEVTHPYQSAFAEVNTVCFTSPTTGWITGEDSALAGMIAATTDGGATWVVRETPFQFNARDLFFLDDQRGWVVGPGGSILLTIDGGRTWKIGLTESTADLWGVRFVDTQHGWSVGAEGAILYSPDGGARWYTQPSGVDWDLFDVGVISVNEAMATGGLGTTGGVVLTRNGGATWRQENLPSQPVLNAVACLGNDLLAGGASPWTDSTFFAHLFHRQAGTGQYPVILVDTLPGGTTGIPYQYRFSVRDGAVPYQWTFAGTSPGWLSLDNQTGVLTGTPPTSGRVNLQVQVTDSAGKTDERSLSFEVISDQLSLETSELPPAVHRKTFRCPLEVSGGHTPYQWKLSGNYPSGLSVDAQCCLVGTPFETGSFDFSIEVIDSGSLPQRTTAAFHLDVASLSEGGWEIQHTNNRITGVHFFDADHGVAIGWSGVQYETWDGGKTWSHQPLGAAAWDFDWVGNEGWMLSTQGLGHTTDQGQHWSFSNALPINGNKIRFRDNLHGWVCGSGIAYTEDGGSTWHVAEAPSGHYFGLDFADSLNGYAGGNNFLFVSSNDSGHTWQSATLPPYSGTTLKTNLTNQPGIAPTDKATGVPQIKEVYFQNALEGWIGTNIIESYSPLLYHTSNGGQSWEKRHVSGKGSIDQFQFLSDGLHGWMGGLFSGAFYHTVDGGANWDSISFGSSTHVLGFHFLDENTGWALPNVVGYFDDTNTIEDLEGSIWKTTDGAENFHLQYGWPMEGYDVGVAYPELYNSPGPEFQDMSFVDPTHGWALARHTFASSNLPARVFFTDSGGADWKVISILDYGIEHLCFANQLRGFALYPDRSVPVFETMDGGQTWGMRRDILKLANSDYDASWGDVTFADDQYGWIVENGDYNLFEGTRVILRTTDGGDTWDRINETERGGLHSFFFLDREHGWMVNSYGFIESTTDGGETWSVQRTNNDGILDLQDVYFTDEFSGWAVSAGGEILSTTNGGTNWKKTTGLPATGFDSLYFATCLKGWFAGVSANAYSSGTLGTPLVIETKDGNPASGTQLPLGLLNHNLQLVDSPDTVNVWGLGTPGLGLKYAAPTNALRVTTSGLATGRINQSYSAQLERDNGTPGFSWRVCGGALPPGIELHSNGLLTGTPTTSATFHFVAAVFDGAGESAGRKFSLRIEPGTGPQILTSTLPDGTVGMDYAVVLEATGTSKPYEWSLTGGKLSPGITLQRQGLLGGLPTTPGNYTFSLMVTDGQVPCGQASKTLDIKILGQFAPEDGSPCDELPLLCLALHWKTTGTDDGDFNGDGKVDAKDAIKALEQLHE